MLCTTDSHFVCSMFISSCTDFGVILLLIMISNSLTTVIGCFIAARNPCIKPLSIEEQCGINLTYPGTTEYTDRYVAPPRDKPTTDFIINPVADYRIDGRPMARQRFLCTETEYEVRYEWPDGERLMKFPWLRK